MLRVDIKSVQLRGEFGRVERGDEGGKLAHGHRGNAKAQAQQVGAAHVRSPI